jgi:hypothetical protein
MAEWRTSGLLHSTPHTHPPQTPSATKLFRLAKSVERGTSGLDTAVWSVTLFSAFSCYSLQREGKSEESCLMRQTERERGVFVPALTLRSCVLVNQIHLMAKPHLRNLHPSDETGPVSDLP